MRPMTVLLFVLLALAHPAVAQESVRPVSQIPLLPLADGAQPDVDDLLAAFWQPYFNTGAEHSFGRDRVRAGRVDLNDDDRAELVLMIDAPGWQADQGNPFVIATWTNKRWVAVGWGWGDEDTLFATDEIMGGWRSVDSGTQLLQWSGKEYSFRDKE